MSYRGLAWAPVITLIVMLGPVAIGLAGTLGPALGWFPVLGEYGFGLEAFEALGSWPGFSRAVSLSVTTGFTATLISLAVVIFLCAGWQGGRIFLALERMLAPLLAVPHAAAAFGLAFLIAPSGWIARGLSPWATGWERPPDLLIVQDPGGLALIIGLVTKEVPFLLLMTLSAVASIPSVQRMTVAQALGYARLTAWIKTVFPSVYAQIRLPVYAVLAYSLSVVDVAIILGPNTPPTLSVQVVRWMSDPDLSRRVLAAAAAIVQLGVVLGGVLVWRGGEVVVVAVGRRWLKKGGRGRLLEVGRPLGGTVGLIVVGTVTSGLCGLAVWSVAGFWSFPDWLPDALTLRSWQRYGPDLREPLGETLFIAVVATGAALVLGLACLEAEYRYGRFWMSRALWLLYVPLLVPQVAFLMGLQTFALLVGVDADRGAVVLAHLVFVLPYVFLILADAFRAWDPRYAAVAAALRAGSDRVFWAVRVPMLLRVVLNATAVGIAVSVGQYLPTLLVGAGRVQTLATDAVALASGGDRRVIGVYALVQTMVSLLPFLVAVILPRIVWRHRRGMLDG